jgi:Uma2 family endonuclease
MVETRHLTADELLRLPDDGWRYELRQGELIRMPPGNPRHGSRMRRFGARLGAYVDTNDLGDVLVGDPGFTLQRGPDTVRGPDVAFIRKERIPPDGLTEDGFWEGAPDLAVEIVSPGDGARDVREKIDEYLAAGGGLVWVLYPRTRRVTVHRPDRSVTELTAADTLDGEGVVPGFACPVAALFD